MMIVSFERWMEILRRAGGREGVDLDQDDAAYRHYFDQGDTPRGALFDIISFQND